MPNDPLIEEVDKLDDDVSAMRQGVEESQQHQKQALQAIFDSGKNAALELLAIHNTATHNYLTEVETDATTLRSEAVESVKVKESLQQQLDEHVCPPSSPQTKPLPPKVRFGMWRGPQPGTRPDQHEQIVPLIKSDGWIHTAPGRVVEVAQDMAARSKDQDVVWLTILGLGYYNLLDHPDDEPHKMRTPLIKAGVKHTANTTQQFIEAYNAAGGTPPHGLRMDSERWSQERVDDPELAQTLLAYWKEQAWWHAPFAWFGGQTLSDWYDWFGQIASVESPTGVRNFVRMVLYQSSMAGHHRGIQLPAQAGWGPEMLFTNFDHHTYWNNHLLAQWPAKYAGTEWCPPLYRAGAWWVTGPDSMTEKVKKDMAFLTDSRLPVTPWIYNPGQRIDANDPTSKVIQTTASVRDQVNYIVKNYNCESILFWGDFDIDRQDYEVLCDIAEDAEVYRKQKAVA